MASSKIFRTQVLKQDTAFVDKDIEDIIKYFNSIFLKISKLLEESPDKKVITLIGEHHFAAASLFHEALILFASSMAGINNLLVEGTSKELQECIENQQTLKILNIAQIAKLAQLYTWHVSALEQDSTLSHETRNQIILESILKSKTHSLVIVGMEHFYDVMNGLAEKDKNVSVVGIKTISKGCDLFILPKEANLSSVFSLRPSYYVIQLNEDNQWALFGVTNQLDKEPSYTQKHLLSALELEALMDLGLEFKYKNPVKTYKLTEDQIKIFHDVITENKKHETLLSDEKLYILESENILQVPELKMLKKYKKEEIIDLLVRILMEKVFLPTYAQTCKLESAKLNPFMK